ncbi:HNH endonuclease [Shewanella sp.]|uniref:HNH endonuclease n=1 Tax=Shewanella sp. TaxID=50422 RepID=UPI003563CD86
MECLIHVRFRIGESNRTKAYKSESTARKGIWKWLKKNELEPDINASYFSPDTGHHSYQSHEQLSDCMPKPINNFYLSQAWLTLRLQILTTRPQVCAFCGRSKDEHGIALEVDHILPRSKHPELALEANNLQILCYECNRGKRDKIMS